MQRAFAIALLVGLSAFALAADETSPEPDNQEWNAQADLELMQGKWRVAQHYAFGPSQLPLGREGDQLTIDGNLLTTPDTDSPVALANDLLELADFRGAHEDDHYIVFTLPGGKALLAGYHVNDEQLVIRYPHTCNCSRSGVVTTLTRINK